MGALAQYMAVDSKTFNEMLKMKNENIIEEIERLSENEECDICDLDKMWDALHFFLTGKPAARAIKYNKLSEAIVGTSIFDTEDEGDAFLTYINPEELPAIIEAMEKVDINQLKNKYTMDSFKSAQIYPHAWRIEEQANIYNELTFCFEGMLAFYKNSSKKNMHIVISIY